MLSDATYRQWTAAFHEGSYYEGTWAKGSDMRFLADDDGVASGMASRIVENRQYEFVSIENYGIITGDVVDTTSEEVKQWANSHENYTFSEDNGVTTVRVDLESDALSGDEVTEMFDGMWPPALQKLKELCEAS